MSRAGMERASELHNPYGDYFLLPKRLGAVPSDRLLAIAHTIEQQPNISTNPAYLAVAASAKIEASLVYDDPGFEYIDYRIDLIDNAHAQLNEVVAIEHARLENGQRDANEQVMLLRAILETIFITTYKDIVCGEITALTREEVIRDLKRLKRTTTALLGQRKNRFTQDINGLNSEIEALLLHWESNLCAIPASKRGGSGTHRSNETHDHCIVILDENGRIATVEEREVKTGMIHFLEDAGRYSSKIMRKTRRGFRTS